MATSALSLYVARVRQHPKLTRAEELQLVRRVRATGDRAAARTLVMANLHLVVQIASGFRRLHPNLLELVQEGNLALIRALRRYDPARPVTLSAYLSSWIRTYIGRFVLSNLGLVVESDRSSALREVARNLHASVRVWEATLGNDDSDDQSATEIEDPDLIAMALMAEDSFEASDKVVEEREEGQMLRAALPEFERQLTAREREIFRARFAADTQATLAQTGAKLGLSAERVRQIERELTDRLRTRMAARPVVRRAG